MAENFNFEEETSELLRQAIRKFAVWASENWTMTKAEAETLIKPTAAPEEYARGYNDGVRAIPDAAELWIEGKI